MLCLLGQAPKINYFQTETLPNKQDNDITLYTYAELKVMGKLLDNPNNTTFVPFSQAKINAELLSRQFKESKKINQ